MQRPRLTKIRGATAAAVAELGQRSDGTRKKMERKWLRARRAGLFIRQAHKAGARIKETVAWLSPPHDASIFGMTIKAKIRCESGGVKNGLNGR